MPRAGSRSRAIKSSKFPRGPSPCGLKNRRPTQVSAVFLCVCFQVPCKAHSICPLVLWAILHCSTIHGCALQATSMPREHVEMAAHDV
jgi:hypothetical protein